MRGALFGYINIASKAYTHDRFIVQSSVEIVGVHFLGTFKKNSHNDAFEVILSAISEL